jgi:hypothetical protein
MWFAKDANYPINWPTEARLDASREYPDLQFCAQDWSDVTIVDIKPAWRLYRRAA